MSLGLFGGLCPALPDGVVDSVACFVAAWEFPLVLVALGGLVLVVWPRIRRLREKDDSEPLLLFPMSEDSSRAVGSVAVKTPRSSRSVSEDASAPVVLPERDAPPSPARKSGEGPGRPQEPEPRPGHPRWPGQRPDIEVESEPGSDRPREPEPSPGLPPEPEPRPDRTPGPKPSPETVAADAELATQRMTLGPDLREPMGGPGAPTEGDNGGAVRYERPPDGTLQLLPGRLEVRNGPGAGEEIRFVRVPGSAPEITFGRTSGPAYRHVQLRSLTVSREHARLVFRDGLWAIRNESSTNPTLLNGRSLGSGVEEVELRDGDQIEMGDVCFVFHHTRSKDRLPFRSSWYTDRGRRATNQDAVVVRSLPGGREVAAVCDGIGSHVSGGIASHVALETLIKVLSEGGELAEAVRASNRAIHRAGVEDAEREGMGTTLVALLRDGDGYQIANVGDSRAYRMDEAGIRQLTRDHSFIAEAMREGRMSAEEVVRSPWRNAVTRNLGADAEVDVDVFGGFDATERHLVLLCTDGVHGVLSDGEIEDIVRTTTDIGDVARTLGERALGHGGEDNVAVAVMSFGSDDPSLAFLKDRSE